MKMIGIFEAKTHLPTVCDQVVASGQSITISRRGKPLVVISPVSPEKGDREGILTALKQWNAGKKESDEPDFPDVWVDRTSSGEHSPLED